MMLSTTLNGRTDELARTKTQTQMGGIGDDALPTKSDKSKTLIRTTVTGMTAGPEEGQHQ